MMPDSTSANADPTGEFEAVTEAELVQDDAVPARRASATVPQTLRDSGTALRALPTREASGARPSPAALMARVEAAMAASARTEAALSDLLRTAKFLSASISAVRDANAGLVRELEVLCEVVDGDGAQRVALERRINRLERILGDTARDAETERAFLVNEHDAFIAQLICDHESELTNLRRRLAELGMSNETGSD